jgi:hypothetical protein
VGLKHRYLAVRVESVIPTRQLGLGYSHKIPLSFMIRYDPKPTFVEPAIPSFDSKCAEFSHCLVSDGTLDKSVVWYESTNKKLWDILFSIFNDHPSYVHIKASRRTKDGY